MMCWAFHPPPSGRTGAPCDEPDAVDFRPERPLIRLWTIPRLAAAFLLWAAPCAAHDFWIEVSNARPPLNGLVSVRLRVGMQFKGDPVPRLQALYRRFTVIDASGEHPLIGQEGMEPAGYLRASIPGLATVIYYSAPSEVELDGAKFEAYLKDEGLDAISAIRARRGDTAKPAKDAFVRCAKALVDVGGQGEAGYDKVAGLPLELVAERDPCDVKPGGSLPVRLLFNGRPLQGALVVALNQADPTLKVEVRTDRHGRANLPLGKGGSWLIKAVHMIPAAPELHADWQSFWASLTFTTRA